jgi:hypothetical protein
MELRESAGVAIATAVDRGRHRGGPSGLAEGSPECRSDGARPSSDIREVVRELNVRHHRVAQVGVGYGTLGGVFKGDDEGRERAARTVLAACKAAKVACAFPVTNTAELEQRMKEGWSSFIMQRRDENALAAIEAGRKYRTPESLPTQDIPVRPRYHAR